MYRSLFSSVLVVLACSNVMASDCATDASYGTPFSEGFEQDFVGCFYAELGFGISRKEPDISNEFGYELDDDIDIAYQVSLGYRLSALWFVQLSYTNLGVAVTESDSSNATAMADPEIDIDYQSAAISLGRFLWDDKPYGINPFVRIGYVNTRFEPDNTSIFADGDSNNLLIGGGLEYRKRGASWFSRLNIDYLEEDVQLATISIGKYFGGSKSRSNNKVDSKEQLVSSENQRNKASPIKENTQNDLSEPQEQSASPQNEDDLRKPNDNPDQRESDCVLLDEPANNVAFAPGSSELAAQSKLALESYAAALQRNPDLLVEIGAHTHASGSTVEELELTNAQAQAVAQHLTTLGVSEGQLIARGYGAKRPIASGVSANDQALNRRVAFRVMNVGACFAQ